MRNITKTHAPQALIKTLFSRVDLSEIDYYVSPLSYDATDWLCAKRNNPRLKGGWLCNHFSAWALLLWQLRDKPRRFCNTPQTTSVGPFEYERLLNRYNLLAKRFVELRDEDERAVSASEDIEDFVKCFYLITQTCDMGEGLKDVGLELRNSLKQPQQISLEPKFAGAISKLLANASLSDLDPLSFIWRARTEAEGTYCSPDTLWAVLPAEQDQPLVLPFHLDHAPSLLAKQAKILTIVPNEPEIFEAYGTAPGNTWGSVKCVATDDPRFFAITNLPLLT